MPQRSRNPAHKRSSEIRGASAGNVLQLLDNEGPDEAFEMIKAEKTIYK
jgi:hypothetical protein